MGRADWSSAILIPAVAATLGFIGPAKAQDIGDPVVGRRIAQAQCDECHGPGLLPGRPATFEAIARMPSTTATALTVYLRTSHPQMPNIILSPTEQDDVIAYILSLKK